MSNLTKAQRNAIVKEFENAYKVFDYEGNMSLEQALWVLNGKGLKFGSSLGEQPKLDHHTFEKGISGLKIFLLQKAIILKFGCATEEESSHSDSNLIVNM